MKYINKTDTSAVSGATQSGIKDMKNTLDGFISDFKSFQSDIRSKINNQDQRLSQLDQQAHIYKRPILGGAEPTEAPYKKAFTAYLRTGNTDGLYDSPMLDSKAMSSDSDSHGGYLVNPQLVDNIGTILKEQNSFRSIANVVNVNSNSYDILFETSDFGTGWVSETEGRNETSTPGFQRIRIHLHELSAMPKIAQRLLDDTAFDIEAWLIESIGKRFKKEEAAAFIIGTGNNQPMGFLSVPTALNRNAVVDKLGYVVTGQANGFDSDQSAATLIDLIYTLPAEYRANGAFVMNSKTAAYVRKMKDGDGRFLWLDAMNASESSRLLGYQVIINENMPDIAANKFPIAFGDFSVGYTIVERPDVRILRDPFSAKPHVLFYATKRIGGGISNFAAIKLLKVATS